MQITHAAATNNFQVLQRALDESKLDLNQGVRSRTLVSETPLGHAVRRSGCSWEPFPKDEQSQSNQLACIRLLIEDRVKMNSTSMRQFQQNLNKALLIATNEHRHLVASLLLDSRANLLPHRVGQHLLDQSIDVAVSRSKFYPFILKHIKVGYIQNVPISLTCF